jgi:hypothetical protein
LSEGFQRRLGQGVGFREFKWLIGQTLAHGSQSYRAGNDSIQFTYRHCVYGWGRHAGKSYSFLMTVSVSAGQLNVITAFGGSWRTGC